MNDVDHSSARRALSLLNPRKTYHRATIVGADRIPASGGCVIVSNHGRLDFDSFILMRLILSERGRLPRLMADHMWFRLPVIGRIFKTAGALDGTPENAACLLEKDEMVLTYPGGVREIMGSRFRQEHIDWDGRRGFARVALEAGVPVIPIAGIGVNSGHVFLSSGRVLGELVFQKMLRLGPDYSDYRDPLTLGILPVPLPFDLAVSFPLPCKLTYFVGKPVHPRPTGAADTSSGAIEQFAEVVIESMMSLLREHGTLRAST